MPAYFAHSFTIRKRQAFFRQCRLQYFQHFWTYPVQVADLGFGLLCELTQTGDADTNKRARSGLTYFWQLSLLIDRLRIHFHPRAKVYTRNFTYVLLESRNKIGLSIL